MKIKHLQLIEGAKQAEGLTVIIDVFRAFSLECYLYDMGVKEIRPIGSIEDAFALSEKIPNSILVGERKGKKCEGFDYGNSPSAVDREHVGGKTVIHTTSAGTQGIVNAQNAEEIITGSLVNAKAIVSYIKSKNPETVSIVSMGTRGIRTNPEDELCAEYLISLLEDREMPDIEERIASLRTNGGEHFFDPDNQEVFPEADYWMCIKHDQFPFVIRVEKDELGFVGRKLGIGRT
ncbi:MAG: 2-phosphosulfolactate phosphatase [Lachnospiraceae bacterium]|nr:2-phosphosulfolactate phosphatase [Lachnospiraceae bacterium]